MFGNRTIGVGAEDPGAGEEQKKRFMAEAVGRLYTFSQRSVGWARTYSTYLPTTHGERVCVCVCRVCACAHPPCHYLPSQQNPGQTRTGGLRP